MKKRLLLSFLSLIILLLACQQTPVRQPTATPEGQAATAVVTETAVPAPTETPAPTVTATPDPFEVGTNDFPWWNDLDRKSVV